MANGADLVSTMTLMGHSKVSSTQVYLDVDPSIQERHRWVADAMSTVRGGMTKERLRRTLTGVRWG
jgi:hypothetical protein